MAAHQLLPALSCGKEKIHPDPRKPGILIPFVFRQEKPAEHKIPVTQILPGQSGIFFQPDLAEMFSHSQRNWKHQILTAPAEFFQIYPGWN